MSSELIGHRIETKIAIAASAVVVWDVLSDVSQWGSWNPLYPQASGTLQQGATLELQVALSGMKPQRALATVRVVAAPTRLLYETINLGGLVRATRFVEIQDQGNQCSVVNGEVMSGMLGRLLVRGIEHRIRLGLEGMNVALKRIAERASIS